MKLEETNCRLTLLKSIPSGETETIPTTLRFVRWDTAPNPSHRPSTARIVERRTLPFDERASHSNAARPSWTPPSLRHPRLYVTGWLKRGPTGHIGTNLTCRGNSRENGGRFRRQSTGRTPLARRRLDSRASRRSRRRRRRLESSRRPRARARRGGRETSRKIHARSRHARRARVGMNSQHVLRIVSLVPRRWAPNLTSRVVMRADALVASSRAAGRPLASSARRARRPRASSRVVARSAKDLAPPPSRAKNARVAVDASRHGARVETVRVVDASTIVVFGATVAVTSVAVTTAAIASTPPRRCWRLWRTLSERGGGDASCRGSVVGGGRVGEDDVGDAAGDAGGDGGECEGGGDVGGDAGLVEDARRASRRI